MPTSATIVKAKLYELDASGNPKQNEHSPVSVQFNPESLKVTFANQVTPPPNSQEATDQNSSSTTQFVGKGTTKLSVQLWFDVTGELPQGLATNDSERQDVRQLTKKVAYFITPQPSPNNPQQNLPPAVRFVWGTFLFDGIMESLEEALEFFSPEGVPLRASLTLALSQQAIQFAFAPAESSGAPGGGPLSGAPPGVTPLTQAPAGASLQALAAARGKGSAWQSIAAANNIENPRSLAPGQLIDMGAKLRRF